MDLLSLRPLYWLLALLPLFYFFRTSLVQRPKKLKNISFILRLLAGLCIVIALCRPFTNTITNNRHIIHMVDVSESIELSSLPDILKNIEAFNKKLNLGDSHQIFIFANGIRETSTEQFKKTLDTWLESVPDNNFRRKTKLIGALDIAKLHAPADKNCHILLYSDGRIDNSAIDASFAKLKEEKIHLSLIKTPSITSPEVSIARIESSTLTAYEGEHITLEIDIFSNKKQKAKLNYICQSVIHKSEDIELNIGINKFKKPILVNSKLNQWQVQVHPEKDTFPINNSAETTINIIDQAKVLAISEKPENLRYLKRALKEQKVQLTVLPPNGLPHTINKLLNYDSLILADIPALKMSRQQMNNIKKYVEDFGAGLIMLGSKNSYGLGGYTNTPVESVLPVTSRFKKEKENPSVAICLVIDKSGSMSGAPIEMARQAAKAAVDLLGTRDQVAIIGFDSNPTTLVDMTYTTDKGRINLNISTLSAGGGTNMYPAMELGYDMLTDCQAKIKHMIVLGDGRTGGSFESLTNDMAMDDITVSTVALGNGADKELFSRIAEIGNGRYYETQDPANVPQIFTKETLEASKSSIKEEPIEIIPVKSPAFLDNIDFSQTPMLLGYVKTQTKHLAKTLLMTDDGAPLLVSGKFGLGKSLAFTSDTTSRWAGEWLDWPRFGAFWSQSIREVMRKNRNPGIHISRSKNKDKITYRIRHNDSLGQPINATNWQAMVIRNHGGAIPLKSKQIGLGLYEIDCPANLPKPHIFRLTDKDTGTSKSLTTTRKSPAEYRLSKDLPPAITTLPKLKAGEGLSADHDLKIRHQADYILLLASIVFLILSIVFRRL